MGEQKVWNYRVRRTSQTITIFFRSDLIASWNLLQHYLFIILEKEDAIGYGNLSDFVIVHIKDFDRSEIENLVKGNHLWRDALRNVKDTIMDPSHDKVTCCLLGKLFENVHRQTCAIYFTAFFLKLKKNFFISVWRYENQLLCLITIGQLMNRISKDARLSQEPLLQNYLTDVCKLTACSKANENYGKISAVWKQKKRKGNMKEMSNLLRKLLHIRMQEGREAEGTEDGKKDLQEKHEARNCIS